MVKSTTSEYQKKVALPLLWIGIGSIVMFFAALTSAYLVRKSGDDWMSINLPIEFTWSTMLIIVSSFSSIISMRAVRSDKTMQSTIFLAIAFLLGVGFFLLPNQRV